MNVNIWISSFEISWYFAKCVFLTMGSWDEGLSQLYLELADAYKKRFMPQNVQSVVLKCSPIWKKTRKSFKTCEHKAQVHSKKEAWKREAMVVSAEKISYFCYGKWAQIGKVCKLLLILVLTYGTAI